MKLIRYYLSRIKIASKLYKIRGPVHDSVRKCLVRAGSVIYQQSYLICFSVIYGVIFLQRNFVTKQWLWFITTCPSAVCRI